MNNNLFNNLQALNFLSSMDTLFQNQLLHNKLTLFPTNSSQAQLALPQALPRINNQLPLDLTMLSRLAEVAKQQELMQQAYQANLQAELLKVQLLKMKQLESSAHKDLVSPVMRKVTSEHKEKLPGPVKTYSKSKNEPEMSLEANIKQILNFLIKNFGHISQKDLGRERQKYEHDECMVQVFDALVSKYASTTKTKEEMIKYVLRKALRSIRDKLKEGTKRSEKEVSKVFYQKYFSGGVSEQEVNVENEDDLLKLLLPFKKTSKDKTMNSTFLSKIFSSEEFCADYNNYLLEFDAEADYDNSAKIKRFISYIATCVKSKKISNILNYKRVPWLKIWINNSKSIGDQLIKEKSIPIKGKKKSKGEANTASSVDTYESDCKVESFSTPESN